MGARLESLARRMLRGFPKVRPQADTLDVLQRALVRLLASLRKLQPDSTRSFFNLAALHLRRELIDLARRPNGGQVDQVADVEAADPASAGADSVAELELWRRFHEAVESLGVEEREIVSLIFYHGWTQPQVAELLQLSERTVRRRWASACLLLQADLGDQFPSDIR